MTIHLTPDSPRRAHARRFGAELRRAMLARSASLRGLAIASGVSRSALGFYRAGVNLPSLQTADRIAEALDSPRLRTIMLEARGGSCELCGRQFVATGNGNQRYCSEDCRRLAAIHRSGRPVRERAIRAERRTARLEIAVAAYCRECEPEGMCRDSACGLRSVSPLGLIRRVAS